MDHEKCWKYRLPKDKYYSVQSKLKSIEHTTKMQGGIEKLLYSDGSMVTLPAKMKGVMMMNVFYDRNFPAYIKEIIESEKLTLYTSES